jgi:hypothetical protein
MRRLRVWAERLDEPGDGHRGRAHGYGRGLAQPLIGKVRRCTRSAPWAARERRSARRPGKTDRLDAHAIAQLVRQEAPHLGAVHEDDASTLLYVAASTLQVFAPDGAPLGVIDCPQPPANCAWAEDASTLYITARTAVYKLQFTVRGIAPASG